MNILQEVPTVTTVWIDSLDPEPIIVKTPIKAIVREEDGDFIASFAEANVNASGDTLEEAIYNLKDLIVFDFFHLEHKSPTELGRARQIHQKTLLSMLARRG